MSYDQYTEQRRRLAILAALFFAQGYRLPLRALRDQVAGIGYEAGIDRIRTDAAWLAEQGLVALTGGAVTITERGHDVVFARSVQPGVSKPAPGELDEFKRAIVAAGVAAAQAALEG